MTGELQGWPERRFSEAIAEGDGISVIPVVRADHAARVAEEAGAEALALDSAELVRRLRPGTSLPLLVRGTQPSVEELREVRAAGADACVLAFGDLAGEEELLAELLEEAAAIGLECAFDVRDEDELELLLERLDPEIIVLSERDPEKGEADLERTLELLPSVPAGKLVVSETWVTTREEILELERAGIDGVLLGADLSAGDDGFSATVSTLTGRAAPGAA